MRKFCVFAALFWMVSTIGFADVLTGVFATNPSEETGGYLHIEFGPCPENKDMTCGKIKSAIKKDGTKNSDYEHLGKLLVWSMKDAGAGKYKSGKIWDPSDNNDDGSKKIYNSKMAINGDVLRVDGCILFFCKGQDWNKVN